ncbi:exodeoxyribonuclease VII small subunit [Aliikangiella sp. IMCC44359]|uniref:exodeoxyribonuclease VII small subunit n=1 Tax=Aliikangiella sp. IMCC44359 TaxID=3459125 RepID=UPI00403ABDA9
MGSKKLSFEEQLKSLEDIVSKLEKGDLPLEDSLAQFEKGVKLTRECQLLLDQAQQKVTILTQDGEEPEVYTKD